VADILLGFMTCAWLFTLGIGGYIHWRYNYQPWKIMRKDLVALAEREIAHYAELKQDIGLRKTMQLDDVSVARAEAREAMRNALRGN